MIGRIQKSIFSEFLELLEQDRVTCKRAINRLTTRKDGIKMMVTDKTGSQVIKITTANKL